MEVDRAGLEPATSGFFSQKCEASVRTRLDYRPKLSAFSHFLTVSTTRLCASSTRVSHGCVIGEAREMYRFIIQKDLHTLRLLRKGCANRH